MSSKKKKPASPPARNIQIHDNLDWSQNLANAIIFQACGDYRKNLRLLQRSPGNKYIEGALAALEAFFTGEWFKQLTKLDGEVLIEKMREEIADAS